jgi:ribosomal protein L37AE/L43A
MNFTGGEIMTTEQLKILKSIVYTRCFKMKCPACEEELEYNLLEKETHVWKCNMCPVIVFELYDSLDIDSLKKLL